MQNQSSLNDVFRFVNLKSANILKAFPLVETDTIIDARKKQVQERKANAIEYVENLKFEVNVLNYGEIIENFRNNIIEDENMHKPTVGYLYDTLNGQVGVEFGSNEFNNDLDLLSELIYFSNYHDFYQVKLGTLKLYLTYQLLSRAHNFLQFKEKDLSNFFKLEHQTNNFIKAIGVADLLVVKQHLLKYETTEIAHIENIMKGETRSREHRFLDRFEETLLYENEKTTEVEKETESTERYEMNREVSKTIQEDQKFSTDLSVSGTYGPTTIAANAAFSMDSSESTEMKSSTKYAKDIMDRSLEKVNERVRTERITKIIKENETKDLHSFTNVAGEGITPTDLEQVSGIYQFVDKIYMAQVFNYGKREMFDLMIPEPASYIHHLKDIGVGDDQSGLKPPDPFIILPKDIDYKMLVRKDTLGNVIRYTGPNHYANWATKYQAVGIELPPTEQVVNFSIERPAAQGTIESDRAVKDEGHNVNDQWFMYPPSIFEIEMPSKYIPIEIEISILAYSDSPIEEGNVHFVFGFGNNIIKHFTTGDITDTTKLELELLHEAQRYRTLSGRSTITNAEIEASMLTTNLSENKEKQALHLRFATQDSANHTVTIAIKCAPSEELIQKWQLDTYQILQTAYQDRLLDHESKLAKYNADKKAQESYEKNNYGVPPSKQKQVMLTELKKHCINLFTDSFREIPDFTASYPMVESDSGSGETSDTDPPPPQIDREKSKLYGDYIRFFEQAFEWSQMQYALYPYFWSKEDKWEVKFKLDDPNYEYQQFSQASAARVLLPVRPGFEAAVAYFLEYKDIWSGIGTPNIDDPIYLSIVDEIREKSGETSEPPTPEGPSWEVRLPTSLIKLKATDDLPEWKIKGGTDWEWEEDES